MHAPAGHFGYLGLGVLVYAAWMYRGRLPFRLTGAGQPSLTAQPAPAPQPPAGQAGGSTLARIK